MRESLPSVELYTIGWIAALPIERAAATMLLDERHAAHSSFEQHPSDTNSYTWGRMGEHNIVIAGLPAGQYGIVSAATTVSNLAASLPHVRVGLLVGIGGGVTRHVDLRLGDVVVSQPEGTTGGVVQYDLGTEKAGQGWERKGSLNAPPTVLLSALGNLQSEHEITGTIIPKILQGLHALRPQNPEAWMYQGAEHDRLFMPSYVHAGYNSCQGCDASNEITRTPRSSNNPEIHYGVIASGNMLVKDAKLRDSVAEIVGQQCLCVEMEAAGLMQQFPCLIIRGICDYADSHKNDRWQRYASATAAAYAKELLSYVPTWQLNATPEIAQVLRSITEDVQNIHTMVEDNTEELRGLRDAIHNDTLKSALDRLPVAKGACYDSYEEGSNPKCLSGTRVELLGEIHNWAQQPDAKSILWLNGMAGTGKSTISRTLCLDFDKLGCLGANFFFKRGEGDRGSISRWFTTVSRQIAKKYPDIATEIKKSIETDSVIVDKGPQPQFHHLVLRPITAVKSAARGDKPVIILMDALDEIEHDDDIKLIISLLALSRNSVLKFFITSRPELAARRGFSSIKEVYQDIILHKVSTPLIERDLRLYFNFRVQEIRRGYNCLVQDNAEAWLGNEWPGESCLERLVEMATPLFIFAATICRFLDDRRRKSPIDATYLPVLNNLVKGLDDEKRARVLGKFKDIVGPIILLEDPLSITVLAKLLNIEKRSISNLLSGLHSVFQVPNLATSPVRLLHLSFRDFLLDSKKRSTSEFWLDEMRIQNTIATNCLRVMETFLREDMCCLRLTRNEGSTVDQAQVDSYIPAEVQYACMYWVTHLEGARDEINDLDFVTEFLQCHFLHWIEALSIMRRTVDGLLMIRRLEVFSIARGNNTLTAMLADAIRIVQYNISIISAAPLQLYSSVLIFAPQMSIIKTLFQKSMPQWVAVKSGLDESWDSCFLAFKSFGDLGRAPVALSHDGSFVVSLLGKNAVQLSLVDTGACVKQLEGHKNPVNSVYLSKHSSLVVSSDEREIRLWRKDTGECVRVLKSVLDESSKSQMDNDSQSRGLECVGVKLSHDSSLIAAFYQLAPTSEKLIQLYRVETGEILQTLIIKHIDTIDATFSNDNTLFLVSSQRAEPRDRLVPGYIWRLNERECTKAHHFSIPLIKTRRRTMFDLTESRVSISDDA
ncbi:hypothetical protein BGZ63DRAFT_439426 [Mariannaea sp. PMI_226]|nr:hypothetical protein BGZ63DRAFT_439426 [Mariannaea sp. PMI_226]